ncbi:MAG TPA: hypothetical protein DDY04_01275 [Bacteroidales bacterium]|nr:hypothetical protein [Bacteroidales bacterium]
MACTFSKSTFFYLTLLALQPFNLSGFAQKMPEAYYRAQAALEQNDTQNALHWSDSCFNTKPYRYQYYLVKGKALLQANRQNEAIDALLQAEKLRPGVASFLLAKTYCKIGDTQSCIEWTRKNLQSIFREPESMYQLDGDFKSVHNLKDWQNIWLTEWYTPVEKDIFYAKYLINNQNYDEAIELLNKRIKSKKSKAELHELRGLAHLGAENFNLALKDFENAYRRSKKNYSYLAQQAKSLYNLNQHDKALKAVDLAIEKSGGKPEYLLLKAQILSKQLRWSQAYEMLKIYLEYYPTNLNANLQLTYCAYESGYYTDALLAIAKMLKFTPNNLELLLLRGKIYLKTDQPRQAIADFNSTIAQNYRVSESYLLKGQALLRIGELNEACRCFSISGGLGNTEAQGMHYNTCKP